MNPDRSLRPATPADQLMAVDVFSELLAATDPSQLGGRLVEQLREVSGARTVLLVAHPQGAGEYESIQVCPARRATLFTAEELAQLCGESTSEELPRSVAELPEGHPLRPLLSRAGVESLLLFPLRVGGEVLATLMLLDLPGLDRVEETAQIIVHLSPVMAMALKSSFAHERIKEQASELETRARDLERDVAERTADLLAANESLAASRLAALNLMEDAVAGRQHAEQAAAALQREVAERTQVEDALRESEERFEEFAGHLPGYLFMHDEDGRYIYVNRRERMDGEVPRQDWFGRTPTEIWDGDLGIEEEARVKRALEGEVVDEVVSWTPSGLNEYLHSIYFRIPRDGKPPLVGGLSLDISEQHKAEDEIRRQAEQLSRTVEGAVLAMSNVVETRDPYTAGHERRVSELATALAKAMGLEGEQLDALRLAALIHDIGKIAVPAEILAKPGRLSEVEFNLIKQHPQSGFEILGAIDFGSPVAEMVLQHHERLDGSGYPRALSGEAVMTEARILAVADVVEAMSSHRPYRPALGMEAALAEIRGGAGEKYDPEVVSACARLFEEQGFAFTL